MGYPTRAVIVAQPRSGGTMLAHALSNHPDVHCVRGEPLHHESLWRRYLEHPGQVLDLALGQEHYRACVVKVNAGDLDEVAWHWIMEARPMIKAICLTRANKIRQAASEIIRRRMRGTGEPRLHTRRRLGVARVHITPRELIEAADDLQAMEEATVEQIGAWPEVLHLTYRDLVGQEGADVVAIPARTGSRLGSFLGFQVWRSAPMPVMLRKANPYPLAEMISEWPQVEAAIAASKWAWCLEDEARWS